MQRHVPKPAAMPQRVFGETPTAQQIKQELYDQLEHTYRNIAGGSKRIQKHARGDALEVRAKLPAMLSSFSLAKFLVGGYDGARYGTHK